MLLNFILLMMIPKDITIDSDTNEHVASFDYYNGLAYAKEHDLKQTSSFDDVFKGTHFIVCCGDVMISIKPNTFMNIKRRMI